MTLPPMARSGAGLLAAGILAAGLLVLRDARHRRPPLQRDRHRRPGRRVQAWLHVQLPAVGAAGPTGDATSEKVAKLAQKLGQLQPFIAVFPQKCMANLHLLGQPNTVLAAAPRGASAVPGVRRLPLDPEGRPQPLVGVRAGRGPELLQRLRRQNGPADGAGARGSVRLRRRYAMY